MGAYRYSLQPSDSASRPEYFDCAQCLVPAAQRAGKATLDPELQRRRLCVLPKFDTSTHPTPSQCTGRRGKGLERREMGLPPDHANAGTNPHWTNPPEDIESQGCPGAWYRGAWYASVAKYARRRTDNGNRVENRLLTMTEDPLVIEAVETLEAYQEQARDEYLRRYHAYQVAKNKRQQ